MSIEALIQGFIFAIMALGVYITYKILDFPDLSVDGTFPLGAAVTAIMMIHDQNPYLILVVAFFAGSLAGMITGIIHVRFKVRDLLAGIIVSTALYTINLRLAGKANVAFFTKRTIFSSNIFSKLFPGLNATYLKLMVAIVLVMFLKLMLDLYLKTKSGYLLRATGDNCTLVTSLGIDHGRVKILGLSLANGLASLSGCVLAQAQGYFDINMGTGRVVEGLASVIIGISIFQFISRLFYNKYSKTLAVIVGSIVYKLCVDQAIQLGLGQNDLKLVTALLFFIILVLTQKRTGRSKKHVRA